MLENLDFQVILRRPGVVWPQIGLFQPDPIQRLRRLTVAAIRQQLRFPEYRANPLHRPDVAPGVARRPVVPGLSSIGDPHPIAKLEPSRHDVAPCRALISATR